MEKRYFVPVILGTGRENSSSERVARYVTECAEKSGLETELVRVGDYVERPITGNAMSAEKEMAAGSILTRADGIVIVAPEYNHGYPGELKLFLDQFYDEYEKKSLGICGVSSGRLGGARMVEVLRTASIELQMVPIPTALYAASANTLFTESGALSDPSFEEKVSAFFEEMKTYLTLLRKI